MRRAPTNNQRQLRDGKVSFDLASEYALILANRDKLKQVFKMYGSIENGEETMSIVEYINMASSFNLTPVRSILLRKLYPFQIYGSYLRNGLMCGNFLLKSNCLQTKNVKI